MLELPPPDGSRDPRIEDPTNRWIVHLLGRLLLPIALRWRVPANLVSLLGLASGAAAAYCFWHWRDPLWATFGLILAIGWLVADGMDGMIARATGTASALGRFLDGICDHGVFVLLYLSLAVSIGTFEGWLLACVAGLAHALQATLYEGERTRFHRRLKGNPGIGPGGQQGNLLVRSYDRLASSLDRWARPFDQLLEQAEQPRQLGEAYGVAAAPAMAMMWVLSNNVRVILIYLACLAGNPRLFWWLELIPLSLVAFVGMFRHRRAEKRLVKSYLGGVQG